MTWQPIDTAPKDDEFVVLYCPNLNPSVSMGFYENDSGWVAYEWDSALSDCTPTHWMPLPPPPEPTA